MGLAAGDNKSMKTIPPIAILVIFLICSTTIVTADEKKECYYLDKNKVQNKLITVVLVKTRDSNEKNSIRLDKSGLFKGEERLCKWSLNGGSGKKEQFSLDGDFAIPILDSSCEGPFSHKYTGVGFGDWFLTLCGMTSGEKLFVCYGDEEYYISVESLVQWTKYAPSEFPVKGDGGH